jgi:glycosyltransferase involved in cell wall biosynthesis
VSRGMRREASGAMHLLCVIDSVVKNGAERSLAALVPRYVRRGMRVDVAYLHERPGLQDELRNAGASLFCLGGRGGRVRWARGTVQLIRERRPDLVHTTLFEADVAGRVAGTLTGVPVVSTLAAINYGRQRANRSVSPWKLRGAQMVDAATARLVARFHAVSGEVADTMAPLLHVPRERIDVVPRGRDPEVLGTRSPERAERVRAALGLGASELVILAVARHDHRKGLDVLLDAFSLVRAEEPRARLLLTGPDGDVTARLHARAAELRLGDDLVVLGPRDDVPELLCLADVFVLPSTSEGSPGALLEAMALEAPIVATDIAAVSELMDGEDAGVLVEPGRATGLADGLLRVMKDPSGASARARVARRMFLSHFTIDRVADRMLDFYDRALGSSDSVPRAHDMDARPLERRLG